jgi:hypothetical protein
MSNDELMTKREMARSEQGAAVSSPPSLGLRTPNRCRGVCVKRLVAWHKRPYKASDTAPVAHPLRIADSGERARLEWWSLRLATMDFSRFNHEWTRIDTNVVGHPPRRTPGHHGLDGCSNNDKIRMTKESANVG